MSRVTPTQVKELKPTTLADSIVQIWIDLANSIIDANLNCLGGDEARLTQIELFLSAHFVELADPSRASRVTKEKADGLSVEYSRATVSESINETTYGYSANILSGGCLANLDKAKLQAVAVGHTYVA